MDLCDNRGTFRDTGRVMTGEQILDRRVQRRLATDRDYVFAENAEEQALAERKIELQEEHAMLSALARPTVSEQLRAAGIVDELAALYEEMRAS